jgi:hypothetical protein
MCQSPDVPKTHSGLTFRTNSHCAQEMPDSAPLATAGFGEPPASLEKFVPGARNAAVAACHAAETFALDQVKTLGGRIAPPRRAPAATGPHSTAWPAGSGRPFGVESQVRYSTRGFLASASSASAVRP